MKKSKNLQVNNMIMTGKLPLIRGINQNDIANIIALGKLGWNIICEDRSPRLSASIEKNELKKNGKKKKVGITIWFPDTINLTGITSVKEAEQYYNAVIKELNSILQNGKRIKKPNYVYP